MTSTASGQDIWNAVEAQLDRQAGNTGLPTDVSGGSGLYAGGMTEQITQNSSNWSHASLD